MGEKKQEEKIQLHTSYAKRKKQHRKAIREEGWGKGVTSGAKLSLKMFHPSFWGTWFAFSLLFILVNILPYFAIKALGYVTGLLMYKFIKSRRYVVSRNLDLAFTKLSQKEKQKLEKEIFINGGMGVFETGMAWYWPDWRVRMHVKVDKKEIEKAKELFKQNSRVLVLTCHFVTLELMARIYAMYVTPGIGIYRSSDHPVIEYLQVKGRLRSNLGLVDRSDPRSMVRALMKGVPIWYAPDQDYGITSAIFAPFFDVKEAATVTGTRDLARIKNTKVQPAWTIREGNYYRLHILDPLENFPTDDVYTDIKLCNETIMKMIDMGRAQYLWMHRRFKTTKDGSNRYPKIS